MFFVLQEAVAFGLVALSNQIEEFQFSEGLAYLSHLVVAKTDGQATEVQFVVTCYIFEVVFLYVFLLEEISGFDHFEGCGAFDVDQFRMGPEEIFDPSGGHSQDGEGFGSVENNVFDGRGVGEVGVGGCHNGIEILEYFLHRNFEGQVAADNLEGVVLGDGVGDLFLGGEFVDIVQFRGESQFFDLDLVDIFIFLSLFVFLLLFLFLLLDEGAVFFLGDHSFLHGISPGEALIADHVVHILSLI